MRVNSAPRFSPHQPEHTVAARDQRQIRHADEQPALHYANDMRHRLLQRRRVGNLPAEEACPIRHRAVDHDFWIGRPVEEPGSRPLEFESGGSLGAKLVEWPVAHTIKCLCFYHPDDSPEMKARQERELLRLHDATRRLERELLVEIIASKNGPVDERTVARCHGFIEPKVAGIDCLRGWSQLAALPLP